MSKPEPVRFVPSLPWLLPPYVAGQGHRPLPFPFSAASLRLTFSGTAAIAQGVKALDLPSGSEVLCPAYHCGHEIEPFIRAGCEVGLYRVAPDLQIDLDDIRKRLGPQVKALLVTHYFGFPQLQLAALQHLCKQNGTLLVEDCAHALFSDNAEGTLGRLGDIAIFSFRKTLPLPHGGGLLINNPDLKLTDEPLTPSGLSTITKAFDLHKKSLLQNLDNRHSLTARTGLLVYLPLLKLAELLWRLNLPSKKAWYDPDDEGLGFDNDILSWGISAYCRKLLPALVNPEIKQVRRKHWLFLQEQLAGQTVFTPAFKSLPDAVCPLFFPVLTADRTSWVKRLQQAQIYAAPWWESAYPKVAWQEFTESTALKAHMIALPLHQDLSDTAMTRMADFLLNS
jgi:perosamine synthetase